MPKTHFTLNGQATTVAYEPGMHLLEVLREECGILSPKNGCAPEGSCGCCTVLVDGEVVSGCLTLAQLVDGKEVSTIESLDADGELSTVQRAFIEEGAFQCGFCTPGFVLMTHDLLKRNPDPDDHQIRDHLSGNLCRCAAYPEILRAVKNAAARMRASLPPTPDT